MKYKTLFRVLVKVIGVWLIANGAITLVSNIAQASASYLLFKDSGDGMYYGFGTESIEVFLTYQIIPGAIQLAGGLYLFFGGRWIANLAIPGNRPYCLECGYDMTHNRGAHCPECGTAGSKGNDGIA